jgi:hypothetical protein
MFNQTISLLLAAKAENSWRRLPWRRPQWQSPSSLIRFPSLLLCATPLRGSKTIWITVGESAADALAAYQRSFLEELHIQTCRPMTQFTRSLPSVICAPLRKCRNRPIADPQNLAPRNRSFLTLTNLLVVRLTTRTCLRSPPTR